ncbi:phosphate/sulfate permease [Halarchaeum solikamskense]|nr:phosphate/sulfate permease [Halarchaeum solikamskense]
MASVALVLAVALFAALFMSFTVGANSNSAPVAPAVSANALSVLRAALLVGVVAGLGAILQGGSISETIGKDLVTGVTITPLAAAAALLTAATLITIGNTYGYPIPSAFTVTGAMVGAGIALGGGFAVHEYVVILGFWFAIPLVESVLAYGLARGLQSESIPEVIGIPVLGGAVGYTLANIQLTVIPTASGAQGSVARYLATAYHLLPTAVGGSYTLGMVAVSVACGLLALVGTRALLYRDEAAGINQFLIVLGLVVVFTSGGTQVGLATGPLETVFETDLQLPSAYLLALGGGGDTPRGVDQRATTRAGRLERVRLTRAATINRCPDTRVSDRPTRHRSRDPHLIQQGDDRQHRRQRPRHALVWRKWCLTPKSRRHDRIVGWVNGGCGYHQLRTIRPTERRFRHGLVRRRRDR